MDLLDSIKIDRLLEKKVKQDKEIKDRDGTQPAKYYAKDAEGDDMAKSTKQDRARHFEKGAEKDDNDPSAYKPAPGDAQAKTKPSQHTKKFKKMFGEDAVAAAKLKAKQADELERLKTKQEREAEALKDRHDRENERQKKRDESEKEKEAIEKQRQSQSEDTLPDIDVDAILEKAESEAQQKLMGMALAYKRGEMKDASPKVKELAKSMSEKDLEDFAKTKHSEVPAKKEEIEEESAADKSLKDKADKTGIDFGILKQVYNRGVAAWRTGHRPGTTPEQWGHARVNSFVTKSSGTWGKADADLARKVQGKKEQVEEGMMVARTHEIIDTVLNRVREKLTKEYRSNPEKGVRLLQSFANMMNFKVSDKAQRDGYLFLKMGDQLTEGKMGDIFYHLQNGDSAETIAKSCKISVKVAKGFIDDFKKHYPREYKQVYETFTEGARERIQQRFYDKLGIDQQTHDFILKKDKEWGEKRLKAIKSPDGLEALMKVDQEIEKEKSKLIQQGKYVKYWEK